MLVQEKLYSQLDAELEQVIKSNCDISAHLRLIQSLASMGGFRRFVDLGTRTGNSLLALTLAAIKNDGHVWAVDIDNTRVDWLNAESNQYVTRIHGDDLTIDIPTRPDFLMIDTSHTYEQTLAELTRWVPYVRGGGIVALHDTISFPSVFKAIIEFNKEGQFHFIHDTAQNGLGILFA